jgi:hypothetical protein
VIRPDREQLCGGCKKQSKCPAYAVVPALAELTTWPATEYFSESERKGRLSDAHEAIAAGLAMFCQEHEARR